MLDGLRGFRGKTCCQEIQAITAAETTRAGLPMPTDWKGTSQDLGEIAYNY